MVKRIIVTFYDPDCENGKEINGHIYEVLEYAFFLRKYTNFDIEIWLPYKNLAYTKISRLLKLRYARSFIQVLENVTFRHVTYKLFLTNFYEIQEILRHSCLVTTDGRFVTSYNKIHPKPIFVDGLIALRCNAVRTGITYCNNFYVLYNQNLYTDYDPSIISPIVFNNRAYIPNYCKKIALRQLLYIPTKNSFGKVTVFKGHLKECLAIKQYVDTILVPTANLKTTLKQYIPDKRIISYPVANFHAKISAYVYQTSYFRFDCSNRLIKECQYFDIPVLNTDAYSYIKFRMEEPLEDVEIENDSVLLSILENY